MLYPRHLSDVQVKTLGRMLDCRSCLGFGRDSGCAAVHEGHKELDTTERLN